MKDPYQDIKFEKRLAKLVNKDGKILLEKEVEFPDYFSDNSVNIVTDKYLYNSAKKQETKLTEMIDRVSNTITEWGDEQGYFLNTKEKEEFNYNLKYFQIHQYCAFNSPVYFNIGLSEDPQLSACFILGIEDDMNSISEILKTESIIFKHGSGSGLNLSKLRGSNEKVNGGGNASGPVSFMKTQDINAGVIKSGGTLRRSARLNCLDVIHPNILDFIECKSIEEKKLKILTQAGIKPYPGYDMTDHVFFQNTNLSVGIFNHFMKQLEENGTIDLKNIMDSSIYKTLNAKKLLMKIAENAWKDGCPGLLFLDTINEWNTCEDTTIINSSNPCGEYLGPVNTSCNLASINLLKFFTKGLETSNHYDRAEFDFENKINFDIDNFKKVIKTLIISQDIIINKASYPTEKIRENTIKYRALGLGLSNLGATLMYLGIPYDSDEGRYITSTVTSFLTSYAYSVSNLIASNLRESFFNWDYNKNSMKKVLAIHKEKHDDLLKNPCLYNNNYDFADNLLNEASIEWNCLQHISNIRNSQVTLMAPTGTISFLMGCDTFGIEPEFSLTKYKTLSGSEGTVLKLENNTIKKALENLNYNKDEIKNIILNLNNIEKSKLKKKHLSIFDTAMKNGTRQLSPESHLKMMSAIQPFISSAISKTINLPNNATIEDVFNLYVKAYNLGLKGITIYRDGSKNSQPLNEKNKVDKVIETWPKWKKENLITNQIEKSKNIYIRHKLPPTRKGINHKFTIGNISGYVKTGEYEDGRLGEIFLDVSKQGSTLSGLLDNIAIVTSMGLQYGVPLYHYVRKMKDTRFEPSGLTQHKDIRFAKSILDYVFKFLGIYYLNKEDLERLNIKIRKTKIESNMTEILEKTEYKMDSSNPICDRCGSIMYKLGSCYNCLECGSSTGTCG